MIRSKEEEEGKEWLGEFPEHEKIDAALAQCRGVLFVGATRMPSRPIRLAIAIPCTTTSLIKAPIPVLPRPLFNVRRAPLLRW